MTGSPIFFPIILTNRIGPLGGAKWDGIPMELRTRIRVIGVNFSDFLIKGKIEILVRVGGNSIQLSGADYCSDSFCPGKLISFWEFLG